MSINQFNLRLQNVPQELPKTVVLRASHATVLKFGSVFHPTTS
jgi:hypothetical protein